MTDNHDMPRVVMDGMNIGGRGYTLTETQKKRKQRGKSIYNRDRQVEEYKVNKGEWV